MTALLYLDPTDPNEGSEANVVEEAKNELKPGMTYSTIC